MTEAIYDGKRIILDGEVKVTADQAIEKFFDAIEEVAKKLPGYTSSGPAMMTIKVAEELLHWMYAPNEHPVPKVVIEKILVDFLADLRSQHLLKAGEKNPTIN